MWITEEKVTEEDGRFYPEIHVWSDAMHLYGYRLMIWFDNYNDAWRVAHMAGKEEIERQQCAIRDYIERSKK